MLCLVAKSYLTLVIVWTVARQVPMSLGFPRQEYWSGLPLPSPLRHPWDPENHGFKKQLII